jgi:hypothetical protein
MGDINTEAMKVLNKYSILVWQFAE